MIPHVMLSWTFPLIPQCAALCGSGVSCSPHCDEFSCHLWGEEGLFHWVTGSFDLTLVPLISTVKLLVLDSHFQGSFQTLEWPNETSRAQQVTSWTFIPVYLRNDDKPSSHWTGIVHQRFDFFLITADVGYCDVQKGLESDEILQNNGLSVSH